jgi:hypothetical protein
MNNYSLIYGMNDEEYDEHVRRCQAEAQRLRIALEEFRRVTANNVLPPDHDAARVAEGIIKTEFVIGLLEIYASDLFRITGGLLEELEDFVAMHDVNRHQ